MDAPENISKMDILQSKFIVAYSDSEDSELEESRDKTVVERRNENQVTTTSEAKLDDVEEVPAFTSKNDHQIGHVNEPLALTLVKEKAAYSAEMFTELRPDVKSKSDVENESSDSESDSSSSDLCDTSDTLTDSEEEAVHLASNRTGPRAKGEKRVCDLPPIEDLHISVPHDKCRRIGVVKSFVIPLVVVAGDVGSPALDLDSILFLEEGDRALGKVFDVFGPVKEPHYCVRFNSKDHVDSLGITPGMTVYCAPETPHSSFILLGQLQQMRGTDASWKDDIEPPAEVQEFSDDEMEAFAKKGGRRRAKCRPKATMGTGNYPDPQSQAAERPTERGRKRQFHYQSFRQLSPFVPPNIPGFRPHPPFYRGRVPGPRFGHFPPRQRLPFDVQPSLHFGTIHQNESNYWSQYWNNFYCQNQPYTNYLPPPPPPPLPTFQQRHQVPVPHSYLPPPPPPRPTEGSEITKYQFSQPMVSNLKYPNSAVLANCD